MSDLIIKPCDCQHNPLNAKRGEGIVVTGQKFGLVLRVAGKYIGVRKCQICGK